MSQLTVHNQFKDFYYEGASTDFDISKNTLNTAIFDNFPLNPPDSNETGGFYNLVVDDSKITFELIDNKGASAVEFENGDFDTYYFQFPANVDIQEFQLMRSDHYNVTIEYVTNTTGIIGIPANVSFSSGALKVRFDQGTNLTEIGQKVVIAYGPAIKKSLVTVYNTFEGGADGELYWAVDYDLLTTARGTEAAFYAFPINPPGTPEGGFYNIAIDGSELTFTLKDNRGAGELVFEESIDRYYFVFPEGMEVQGVVEEAANYNVTVSSIPAGTAPGWGTFINPGVENPAILSQGALMVEFGHGSNLTVLDQEIIISLEMLVRIRHIYRRN